MQALRTFILERPRAAILALLIALCMKALMPAGFMVSGNAKTFTVTLCTDGSGGKQTVEIAIPTNSAHKADKGGDTASVGKCAFSGLGTPALGGADALLLAFAFAFILMLGLAPAKRLPFRQTAYLRPPLRGPPALI